MYKSASTAQRTLPSRNCAHMPSSWQNGKIIIPGGPTSQILTTRDEKSPFQLDLEAQPLMEQLCPLFEEPDFSRRKQLGKHNCTHLLLTPRLLNPMIWQYQWNVCSTSMHCCKRAIKSFATVVIAGAPTGRTDPFVRTGSECEAHLTRLSLVQRWQEGGGGWNGEEME